MEEYIRLQQRIDEIWDLLEDPTLPPLDRQMLNEEMIWNTIEVLRIQDDLMYEDESFESESIGSDEYDRECVVIEAHFDLENEI